MELRINSAAVTVVGISFNPTLSADSDPIGSTGIPPLDPSRINILMMHYPIEGFEGFSGDEPSARLSSIPAGFDLVVAGHHHKFQQKRLGQANCTIVYPGSTERSSFNEEEEEKGFALISIDGKNQIEVRHIQTSARPIKSQEIDATGVENINQFLRKMIEKQVDPNMVLRVRLVGKVTTDQLATYRRSEVAATFQDQFFRIFLEEDVEIETPTAIEALPRTTPLQELTRYFDKALAEAHSEEEKQVLEEARKVTQAKLVEEGAW